MNLKGLNLKDSESGYSWLSIVFHWLTALTVITLYILGDLADDASKEQRSQLLGLHISIAASMYIILWGRIVWRASVKRPAIAAQGKILDWLAYWIPVILLAAIALMLLSGPIMVWSGGRPINIFGLIELASPLGKMETLHEAMEVVHKSTAKVILFAFLLHIAGVLKHLLIDRDDTLKKILIPGTPESGAPAAEQKRAP